MKGGPQTVTRTNQSQEGTSSTNLDAASQLYLENFLRPLGQQGAGAVLGAPGLPGVDPSMLAATAGLNNPYAGPGAAPQMDVTSLPLLSQLFGGGGGGYGNSNSFSASFGGGGGGSGFTPGQLDISRIADFFNPQQEALIGQTQTDFDRQRALAQQAANRQATSEGAFGGSRSAVLAAEGLRGVNETEATTLANLRNSGYESARQAALQEFLQGEQGRAGVAAANASAGGTMGAAAISASQRAQEAARQLQFSAGQFDISNELQRRLANQGNSLAAYQATSAANQAANNLDLNRLNSLYAAGQGNRDVGVQQQQDYLNRWLQAVNIGATGLGPTGSATSSTSTSTGREVKTEPGTGFGDLFKLGLAGASLIPGVGEIVAPAAKFL